MSMAGTENLGSIITSALARKVIYGTYVIVAFVVAGIQVGFSAATLGQPVWLTVTVAVTAFVGAGVSGLAIANAPSTGSTATLPTTVTAPVVPVATDSTAATSVVGD